MQKMPAFEDLLKTKQWTEPRREAEDLLLVRALCGMQTHRGGEIRRDTGAENLAQRPALQGLDAGWWQWVSVISCRWKLDSEPIAALEGRGFLLSLKWRFRKVTNLNKQILHLLDSQSCIGAFVKHRSKAHSMNFLCKRAAAMELASSSQVILAFCRSHRNPADEPSRRFESPSAKTVKTAATGAAGS